MFSFHRQKCSVATPPTKPPSFSSSGKKAKVCIPYTWWCREPPCVILQSIAGIYFRNKGVIVLLGKDNKSVSMVTQVGTACTYTEMTCSGTALKQPSGASYWEVAVTHSSWADAEWALFSVETTLRDCLRWTTTVTTTWNWTGQSWVRVYCHVKWHTSPPLLDVTDQLQLRHIPLQQTCEWFYTDK